MNRFFGILILFIYFQSGGGQIRGQEPSVKLSTGMDHGYTSLEFNGQHFVFEASLDMIRLDALSRDPENASIAIPGYYLFGETGSPAIPRISILFEAGRQSDPRIRILQMDSVVFDLKQVGAGYRIGHFRPSARKNDRDTVVQADSVVYHTDAWIGGPLFEVEYQGSMRGLSMSNLHFSPVQYNPVRNQLKVYYHVRCTIETRPPETTPEIDHQAFSGLFSRVVRLSGLSSQKAVQAEQPMTLVILSDTSFRKALQPLVQWKNRKGFRVIEAYRYDSLVGGTRESMKAFLKKLYESPPKGIAPPSFLLIVGDREQIPLSQYSGEITDLYYAEYDGEGDYIPEIFYGRISVTSPEQLQGVLDKILEYEQYRFPDPSFLDKAVLIAGVDGYYAGTFGNGQINYVQENYLNPEQGTQAYMFRYPESDTSDRAIRDLVSEGVGFVNYTGHGRVNMWENPAFRTTDIENLENLGKYPVMIGNGCETNYFTMPECFAEALLRARGKGALAYIGCTNDSYWDEDYYWAVGMGPVTVHPQYEDTSPGFYDKVFHTHNEPREFWTPSLGEMVFGGNMSVQQSSSQRKKLYWEIYQLAGDPTLVPWFKRAGTQKVLHPEFLPVGSRRLDVSCAPYSYLALSRNGELLDAMHASGEGYATLQVPETLSPGTLELVVTGDRFRPYMEEIILGTPGGIYLDVLDHSLVDESVEPDHFLSPGEVASLDLNLVNRGVEAIIEDTLLLFSGHRSVEILDSLHILEQLDPMDTLLLSGIFRFSPGYDFADQSGMVLGIQLKGTGNPLYLKETINSPVLISGGISWEDRTMGNGNGMVEPGEWLFCKWALRNEGHFRTEPIQGNMPAGILPHIEQVVFKNRPVLEPGESGVLQLSMKVANPGKGWHGSGSLSAGDRSGTVVDSFLFSALRYFEDFSEGSTSRFPFINSSPEPWRPDSSSFTSSLFSFRSGEISHTGRSELKIRFETTATDSLSFSYRVSSEAGYDFLGFYVDSVLELSWSGETGWNTHAVLLEAGSHEIVWSYQKDQNRNLGEDAAWIDDIIFPESAFRQGDLSLMEIMDPTSGPWLTSREQVSVRVRNTSDDTIHGFTMQFSLNGIPFAGKEYTGTLLPGEDAEVIPDHMLDLSALGTYILKADIISDSLGYPGNNWLEKTVARYGYPDLALSLAQQDIRKGLYADVAIQVENTGNVSIDSFRYEIWRDNRLVGSGARFIGLAQGEITEEIFRLVDSVESLSSGIYEYLIRATDRDSVVINNEVSGWLTWWASGISAGHPGVWLVYPNPSSTGFHVILADPAGEELLFEMVSLSGTVAASATMARGSDQLRIPTESVGPGTYLLRLVNSGKAVKVVIDR